MAVTNLGKVKITPKGAWDVSTTYAELDMITYGGGSYVAKTANTGVTPVDGDTWQLCAAKGDTGAQGQQGIQGIQGDKGDPGASTTITATNMMLNIVTTT